MEIIDLLALAYKNNYQGPGEFVSRERRINDNYKSRVYAMVHWLIYFADELLKSPSPFMRDLWSIFNKLKEARREEISNAEWYRYLEDDVDMHLVFSELGFRKKNPILLLRGLRLVCADDLELTPVVEEANKLIEALDVIPGTPVNVPSSPVPLPKEKEEEEEEEATQVVKDKGIVYHKDDAAEKENEEIFPSQRRKRQKQIERERLDKHLQEFTAVFLQEYIDK